MRSSAGRFAKYSFYTRVDSVVQDFSHTFEERSKKGLARDNYV